MSLLTSVLKLWRTGQYLLPADSGFSPKHLFAGGRVGWWLDPLDFGYARQDSAGATAYTAVEQGVGMAVDKSANGLTFVQASGPAKPVVSARVNYISSSEFINGLSDAVTRSGLLSLSSITGYVASVTVANTPPPTDSYAYTAFNSPALNAAHTISAVVSISGGPPVSTSVIGINTNDFTFVFKGATYNATPVQIGTDLYRVTASAQNVNSGQFFGVVKYSSNTTRTFKFTALDVRLSTRANIQYQRVNTATDYDTAGFPHYLKFDGAATHLVGASGGGATAGFYFGAAVQFGKVGAVQTIVSDAGTNTGFKIRTTAANQIEISAGNGAAFTAVNTTEAFAAGDVAFIELFDNGTNLSACLGNGAPVTVARPAVSAGTAQMTLAKDNNAASNYAGISIFSAVYLKDYCPSAAQRADYKRWALLRAGVAS